jgi:bifunctional non-homologous end joining protein LigD
LSDRVPITHPEKVLFPDDGITKGDLVAHYLAVAPRMLPLVSGRPVTLQRFPDGIGRGGFLQKQVGRHFPDWIERVTAPNRRTRQATVREEVTYAVCRTADDLAYLANQGCITPHVWLSRVPDIHHPDQMVFDLDPASEDLGPLPMGAGPPPPPASPPPPSTGCSTSSGWPRSSSRAGRAACTWSCPWSRRPRPTP